MTPDKVLGAIERYRLLFEERGICRIDYPHDELLDYMDVGLEHCHGMLDKMVDFVREGEMGKVFRWLGFIQGVLWVNRVYTMIELREHNRS